MTPPPLMNRQARLRGRRSVGEFELPRGTINHAGEIESTLEIIRKPSIFRDDLKKVEIGGVRVTISQGTIYVPRGGLDGS